MVQFDMYESVFLQLIGILLNVSESQLSNVPVTSNLQFIVSSLSLDCRLREFCFAFSIFNNLDHVYLLTYLSQNLSRFFLNIFEHTAWCQIEKKSILEIIFCNFY